MQLDPLKKSTSIDSKTAEEALALAIRLQQESGDRVSLDELQKTADEAGIDRVYLENALHQISKTSEHEQQVVPRQKKRVLAMALGGMYAILIVFVINATQSSHAVNPALYIFLAAGAIGARFALRDRGQGIRRRRFRDWY